MPTYEYRREDGTTFEVQQSITEPALESCPTTGQPIKRVISGAGLVFKGNGFYLTDYARSGNKTESAASSSES
ncbi:MAG: zinc ribbon domain-containing protein [Bacteroidetes Order II. Incertae sedis bacterium]|nr:zinc ribbon domain-containing protein [Bacteroidetes Order II. bacterium]